MRRHCTSFWNPIPVREKNMNIGIIGGGASGMIAAISAAGLGAHVTILEGGDKIGRKILATGNGKCNFTNARMDNTCFRSNTISDITPFLEKFGVSETLRFFESLHMLYKSKNGYYYPASEQASTVLDVLRYEIEKYGDSIQVLTGVKAKSLTYIPGGGVKVQHGTESFRFDRVIVACGSKASPKTGSDGSGYQLLRSLKTGCEIEKVVPALVQLRCKADYLKAVAGVRIEGRVKLLVEDKCAAQELGEIQLTDYGVSGIPVFQISRFASYGCEDGKQVRVQLDLMPHMDEKAFADFMNKRRKELAYVSMETFYSGLIHKKVCSLFCKMAGIALNQTVNQVPDKNFNKFVELFKNWNLTVEKPNGFDMAQICAGGLSMQEINSHFAMKRCPDVYVAGELLDVDGICGGYNLQWAWTSGYLAGQYAVLD